MAEPVSTVGAVDDAVVEAVVEAVDDAVDDAVAEPHALCTHRGTRAVQRMVEHAPSSGGLALWVHHKDLAADDDAAQPAAPAWTDGLTVYYRPAFAQLPLPQQAGWVAHEVLHIALRHAPRYRALQARLGQADLQLFNVCADAIVNSTLAHLGWLQLPTNAVRLDGLLASVLGQPQDTEAALMAWDVERLYLAVDDRRPEGSAGGQRSSLAQRGGDGGDGASQGQAQRSDLDRDRVNGNGNGHGRNNGHDGSSGSNGNDNYNDISNNNGNDIHNDNHNDNHNNNNRNDNGSLGGNGNRASENRLSRSEGDRKTAAATPVAPPPPPPCPSARRQDGPRAARTRALALAEAADLQPGAGSSGAPEDEAEAAREWGERLLRAHAGDGEQSMLRTLLADLPRLRTPWEQALRTQLARGLTHQPGLSWSRPARSWLANQGRTVGGRRLSWEPGISASRPVPRLVVVVDVSGSIEAPLLERFASEIEAISRRLEAALVLVVGDDRVQLVQTFEPGLSNLRSIGFHGGGGTDFTPLLQEAQRHRPDITVVLTDLEGPARFRPRCPVIWAVPDAFRHATPPFGRLLVLH